ncbi:hypothetical protein D8I30_00530 [Brevundimonas naejangsanensis]|uniref:DUF4189 domain-containing protein n=1 Tax=Brevundimonas naejangsanensis TaxID=588932 RepID=A0A494RH42_9CAUL|nr:hypothetical protein [Brevundimonas naejangsanensis]AYG93830.1 hypothetical protein D8I30_00530 [Brevundimonas naejangsanensis]
MSRNARTLVALTAAVLISGLTSPAFAQQAPQDSEHPQVTEAQNRTARNRQRQSRQAQPKPPSAEEIQAAAQGVLTATNTNCSITEAKLLGQSAAKESLYEVSCASGPGYLLLTSTPPQATDCLVLAASAQQVRARDPEADVGSQCTLPANDNAMAVFTAFAKEAGLACTVDQGAIIGSKPGGAVVYEIGCAGVDGAQINKAAGGWEIASCLELASANATCRFTTPQEQAATLKRWLAGSEAAGCDVAQARYMGKNANGAFYEVACQGAEGFITRLNAEHAVQQIYPCATAQQIGGGCKLTAAAPAATEPNS